MRNAIITITAGLMLMTVTSGCAAWTTNKSKNNNSMWSRMQFWKKPYQRPQKMAAIWTHDILTMTAKPTTRGFGGRIYFYNEKSQAIPVDGELTVHGYEESRVGHQIAAEKTKADKTFVFTAEQFTEHFSSSELGASYSVWIPWDAADGMQKEITLIPTFKGTDGSLVQGEPAKLVLPGRTIEDPLPPAAFQQVSYEQSEMPTNTGSLPGGMQTTTISRSSKINRPSKKPTQNAYADAPTTQANMGYKTEVRYGNNPITPAYNPLTASTNQLTAAGGQAVSRSLSLYPDQSPVGMNAYPGAMQNASYPNASHANASYPNVSYPSPMPQMAHPGAMPNTQPGPPVQSIPGFQGQQVTPPILPNQTRPGFVGFDVVNPQAVQSAFATQWQTLGQPLNPALQQPQQNPQQQNLTLQNYVQQAGFYQSPTAAQVQVQVQGQVQGQVQRQLPPVQTGQSNLQMNRY